MTALGPKWDPEQTPAQDGLTLTERRKAKNRWARKNEEKITFDPSVTTGDTLAQGFRVFTDPGVFNSLPANRTAQGANIEEEATTAYTDGSCLNNGDLDAKAGSGVWFGQDDERNRSVRLPGPSQSNQAAEVFAVLKAVEATPPFAPLHIISDSRYAIDGLTEHLTKWQDKGWINVANASYFKKTAYALRTRSAPTTFEWVKGHSGEEGNEEADRLAGEGAEKPAVDPLSTEIPDIWNLTGAKLASLTQALAYQGILRTKGYRQRPATEAPLDMARHCVHDHLGGRMPTDATLWHSLRHKDVSRNISDFLWRVMHNSYRVGKYWNNIPGYEERATCPKCGTEESMAHILVDCEEPGRAVIWELAKKAWQKAGEEWPQMHLGNILGAAMAEFKNEQGRSDQGGQDYTE